MSTPERSVPRFGLALAAVAFAVLTAAVFRPTPGQLVATLPAAEGSSADALLLVWATSHVSRTLFTQPLALFDAGIFHPLPHALALGDHMIGQAILGLPVWLTTGNPLLEFNLLSLGSYVAGATAMFAYARSVVGGGAVPALVAGVVFAFTPFRFASPLWLQLLWTAFVPLALLAWLRFIETRSVRAWLLWVGCWTAQGLLGQYLALYFTLIMGAVGGFALLASPARRDARLWLGTLLAPLAVGALLWPTVAPYLALRETQNTIRTGGLDTPLGFLWPGPGTLLATLLPAGTTAFGPGVVASLLAIVGLLLGRRGPTPRLALPSSFVWAVHAVGLAATLLIVLAPLRWQHFVPGLDMTRNANRALLVGLCFVAALAASAVRWCAARARWSHLAATALLVLALADMGTPPRDRRPFPVASTLSPGVRRLADSPPDAVVYERDETPDGIAQSMYHAIFHRRRLPVGYSGFVTPGGEYVTQRLSTFPSPSAVELLRRLDVSRVLVREANAAAADDLVARASAAGARLDGRFGSELVFDVEGLHPAPPPPSARPLPSTRLQVRGTSGTENVAPLVDGDTATAWRGAPVPGAAPSLTVDLGSPEAIAGLVLTAPVARAPAAFRSEIELSDDGAKWHRVQAVFEPDDLPGFLAAPPAHVRFVARFPPERARFLRVTNPFIATWQETLPLIGESARRLGLTLDLGWHGEWILDELQVLVAADGTNAS